ncbi:MAG: hypothetical protein AABX86_02825, partial [Nanoarchaeota archaeon]
TPPGPDRITSPSGRSKIVLSENTLLSPRILRELLQKALRENTPYVLKGESHTREPIAIAHELGDILNQAYQSELYNPSEKFYGTILYEQEGRFVVHEP